MKKLRILALLAVFSNFLFAQSESFTEGRWHSSKGEIFEGLISFQMPNNFPVIYYKEKAGDKPIRIKASKMTGFVVGSDTFATVYDFTVEGVNNPRIRVGVAIAKVIEVGKIHLYEFDYLEQFTGGSYGASGLLMDEAAIKVFMVRDSDGDDFLSVRESQASFNVQMAKLLQANTDMVTRIEKNEYSILKVKQLIREYNEWYARAH